MSDVISVGVNGTAGIKIDELPSNDLRLGFTSNNKNTVIGDNAATNKIGGNNNVFIGSNVALQDKTSSENTIIGSEAGRDLIDASGKTVMVGTRAGAEGKVNSANVYIGYESGRKNDGVRNVFLGHRAGDTEDATNDRLIINNGSLGNTALIFGRFGNLGFVRIAGDLEILPKGSSSSAVIRMPDDRYRYIG